jgi:hypothetical protein
MNTIQQGLISFLPPRRKQTPSGWISFNSPCCHNRGESRDTRQRGGILFTETNGFNYHCFNCGFKAGWGPGRLLTKNTRQLFQWFGMPDSLISEFTLLALKSQEAQTKTKKTYDLTLLEKTLPDTTKSLVEWAKTDLNHTDEQELIKIFEYLDQRGMNIDWYPWHWSHDPGYKNRIIVPFYYQEKLVGWTARKITDGKPKYLSESQPGYVFNLDHQINNRKYVIVVEGPFDAIAIDGVAILHNEPNEIQCMRINALGKQVIVVPDRDKPGAKMLHAAIENNWSVSLPPWQENIKDVADAVKQYGRLYTLFTILHYQESNKIKIQLLKKKLEELYG